MDRVIEMLEDRIYSLKDAKNGYNRAIDDLIGERGNLNEKIDQIEQEIAEIEAAIQRLKNA